MDKKGSDCLGQLRLGKLESARPEKLTLGITWTWAWMVSKTRHKKGIGTHYEAPVMSTTVSEEGGGRWTRNIPNEGPCLLWLEIIRDNVSVSWNAMSEK